MDPAVKLADFSDPVLLADLNGRIVWRNEAFELLSKVEDLSQFFSEADLKAILSNEGILIQETELGHLFGFQLKFNLVSCRLGNGKVENDLILMILKAAECKIGSRSGRENALHSVAHDLKNPLGAIFGYADALIDTELSRGLNDRHKEILARIRSTAVRSIELVRNLQQLSTLSAPEIRPSQKASDLNQIALSVFKGTWKEESAGPAVELKLCAESLPIFFERILLDRVVSNLYSNALKFTPRDGKIIITTFSENGFACFEITNTNAQIAEDELKKIFESRYRAKNSTGVAGSGLGLYIVKEIMNKLEGRVSVKSGPDKITVFTAYFPMSKAG